MGAALLAIAGSENEDIFELSVNNAQIKSVYTPQKELVEKYEEKYNKFRRIYPTVKDL